MIAFAALISVGCILSLLGWAIMFAGSDPNDGSGTAVLFGAILVGVSVWVFDIASRMGMQ